MHVKNPGFEWHKRFRESRTDVEDDERSRRPTASKYTNNIREIEKIVREDRRLSIRLIAERMSIDKKKNSVASTAWQIAYDKDLCNMFQSFWLAIKKKNAKRFALTFQNKLKKTLNF